MGRPDCLSAASYSAALRLYAPFDRSSASTAASLTLYHFRASLPEADRRACGWFERQIRSTSCDAAASARRDSAEQLIYATLRLYERTVDTWVVEWGRQTYEQAIREFVRAIDVRCFEPKRRVQRAVTNGDTVALRRAQTDPSGFHCR